MDQLTRLFGSVTRRGLLVGTAGIGAALALRRRPASVEPRAVPPDRSFPTPELLVSPTGLTSQPARLLDASDLADFRGDHIPGARHVWWQDTMELNSLWYGTVLKPDDGESDQTRRQQLLERWQVVADVPVVVYDRDDGSRAARVVWFLRFLSVPAQILDGGFAGWLALDDQARRVTAAGTTGPFAVVTPRQGFYLSVSQVVEALNQPGVQIVDVRTSGERIDGAMPARTVPGTVWLRRDVLIDDRGLVRAPAELADLIAQAGIDLAGQLVMVGDTGLDASLPWLALSLMGAASVAICDGGWQQWAETADLPTVAV
jgi:thiosulfate/3-mercaptopyruvate sulfurtransferase